MNILDGISGFANSAYNAASQAASAASNAAGQAASAMGAAAQNAAHQAAAAVASAASSVRDYTNPQPSAPNDSGKSSSTTSAGGPAPTTSSQAPPHASTVHEAENEPDSNDKNQKNSAGSKGQNAAEQQSKGWSPYQPLPRTASLGTHFEALKNDAIYTAKKKMETELAKLKIIEAETNLLSDLLDKINALSEAQDPLAAAADKGGFDCKNDAELQQLMANGRNIGMEIPEKTKFTKREKDLLIKLIERKAREQDRKLKEQTTKIEESKTMLNEFVSILKTCADKIFEAIKKILQNIKTSAS